MVKNVGKKLGALFGAALAASTAGKAVAQDVEAGPSLNQLDGTPDTTLTTEKPDFHGKFHDAIIELEQTADIDVVIFSPQLAAENQTLSQADKDAYLQSDVLVMDKDEIEKDIRETFQFPEGAKADFNDLEGALSVMASDIVKAAGTSSHHSSATFSVTSPNGEKSNICLIDGDYGMTSTEDLANMLRRPDLNAKYLSAEQSVDFTVWHEVGHCLSKASDGHHDHERDNLVSAEEALVDTYALAMDIKRNGYNPQAIDTFKNVRVLGVVDGGDSKHYSVTAMNRALPEIEEAYASGKLQRMSAYEVFENVTNWTYGETEQERIQTIADIEAEQIDIKVLSQEVHRHMHNMADGEPTPDVQAFMNTYERAVEHFQPDMTAEIDKAAAAEHYQQELGEILNDYDTPTAKLQIVSEKTSALAEKIDRLNDKDISGREAMVIEDSLLTTDGYGLNGYEKYEILKGEQMLLEREAGIERTPDKEQTPEPTRTASLEMDMDV